MLQTSGSQTAQQGHGRASRPIEDLAAATLQLSASQSTKTAACALSTAVVVMRTSTEYETECRMTLSDTPSLLPSAVR